MSNLSDTFAKIHNDTLNSVLVINYILIMYFNETNKL